MLNEKLPYSETNSGLHITFCGSGKCKCPSVDINKDNDTVILGGKEEGFTRFTKEQFNMFIKEAKAGTFDTYIKEL